MDTSSSASSSMVDFVLGRTGGEAVATSVPSAEEWWRILTATTDQLKEDGVLTHLIGNRSSATWLVTRRVHEQMGLDRKAPRLRKIGGRRLPGDSGDTRDFYLTTEGVWWMVQGNESRFGLENVTRVEQMKNSNAVELLDFYWEGSSFALTLLQDLEEHLREEVVVRRARLRMLEDERDKLAAIVKRGWKTYRR